MIDFNTGVLGYDLETQGNPAEYALQPWRVREEKAWVSAAAFTRGDTSTGQLYPSVATLKAVLTPAAEKQIYVCGWNVSFDVSWLIALGLEDLAFQIKWLDSMLLWRHLVVEPEGDDVPKHKRKPYTLEAAVKEYYPDEAGFKEFKNFQTSDPEELKRLLFRCKEDTRTAVKLGELFWIQLTTRQQQAALIEARCIPQVARANVKGIWSSAEHARNLQLQLIRAGEEAMAKLCATSPEVASVNLGSPKQLGELLFDTWGLPSLKQTKGTDKNPQGNRSTDKNVLYELAFKDPRAKLLKEVRESKNNCTKYATATLKCLDYNGDGYLRPGARIFSTYCVPGDTEVLTRNGWVRLDAWGGGEIAQVYPDQSIEFLEADLHRGQKEREWVHINHSRLSCFFTSEHTIAYLSQRSKVWMVTKAKQLLKSALHIPLSGTLKNISGLLTPLQMQVLAMFQADGYICKDTKKPSYKFMFVKQRKIDRAKTLLTEAGVVFREYVCAAYPNRVELTITVKNVPSWWCSDYKFLGPWILDTTPQGLKAFVDELVHWDGSVHMDGGFTYSSFIKSNIEWVATAAHLTGYRSTIHSSGKTCHISYEQAIATIHPERHVTTPVDFEAETFCPVTITGFWLARRDGKIFITGNSSRMTYSSTQTRKSDKEAHVQAAEYQIGVALHQWKRGKEFRRLIRPPEGFTLIELDFAGQEFGWMAVASKDRTMLSLREPGEDAHSYMGAQIAQIGYRELIARVEAEDPAAELQRKLGKFANLSFQYRVGPKKALEKARVDYEMDIDEMFIKQILATYKSTYPGVPDYWRDQISKCKMLGYAETFAGRRVQLKGSWTGRDAWAMESSAINYPIQGTGGDQKYLALAVARNRLPEYNGHFYFELHDGLFLIVPHAKAEKAAVELCHTLSNLPYKKAWGVDLPITFPVDVKMSPESWGDLKKLH